MKPESVKVKRNGLHNLNIELRYLKENNYPIPPYLPTPSRPSPPPSTTDPASLYNLEPGRFRLYKNIAAPTVLRPHPTPNPQLQFSIPDASVCIENYTQPPYGFVLRASHDIFRRKGGLLWRTWNNFHETKQDNNC